MLRDGEDHRFWLWSLDPLFCFFLFTEKKQAKKNEDLM